MGFTYLHILRATDGGGGIVARVTESGVTSLGSANSRNSASPIGVFQIARFEGLECVDDDDLIREIEQRSLQGRFVLRLTSAELLAQLSERLLH